MNRVSWVRVYPRKPPCTHCGSFDTHDHGRKGKEVYQRRRCETCGRTFHAVPIWFVWRNGRPANPRVKDIGKIQPIPTATPLNKPKDNHAQETI